MLNYKFHANLLLISMFTSISTKENYKMIMKHIVSVISSGCPAHEGIPDIQECEGSDMCEWRGIVDQDG